MARFDMNAFYGRMVSEPFTDLKPLDDSLRSLSEQLVRGLSDEVVSELISEALEKTSLEDTFVLLFHTRDIRGKGERRLSMAMWNALLVSEETKALALNLIDLIPHYGCWQDIFKLPSVAWSRMLNIVDAQIQKDEIAACDNSSKISLLAKWMPREGQPMANFCAAKLVPGQMFHGARMKAYRKRVSALNKLLNTVEIKMCSTNEKSWASIDPSKVPGGAMKKYSNAFLNERKGCLRYPDSDDRMDCRENFEEHLTKRVKKIQHVEIDDPRYDLVRERVRSFLRA